MEHRARNAPSQRWSVPWLRRKLACRLLPGAPQLTTVQISDSQHVVLACVTIELWGTRPLAPSGCTHLPQCSGKWQRPSRSPFIARLHTALPFVLSTPTDSGSIRPSCSVSLKYAHPILDIRLRNISSTFYLPSYSVWPHYDQTISIICIFECVSANICMDE